MEDRMAEMNEMNECDSKINTMGFFNFATFDIMAELCFGQPLLLLRRGDYIPWVRSAFAGMKLTVYHAVLLDIPAARDINGNTHCWHAEEEDQGACLVLNRLGRAASGDHG
jgi:hypothetical protein